MVENVSGDESSEKSGRTPSTGADACHVARVYWAPGEGTSADSPTLSPSLLIDLAAAMPRHVDVAFQAKRLRAFVLARNTGPLALLIAHDERNPLEVPGPLVVPFEPQELNDREERLAGLCGTNGGNQSEPKNASRWGDFWTRGGRLGMPIMGVFWVVMGLCQWLSKRDLFALLFGCGLGLFLIVTGWVISRTRDQWWLVPGGMVLRSPGWLPWRTKLRLVTPQIADLILFQRGGRFHAMLFRDGLFAARGLTRLEATALLAAWQSPLKPPRLDQLADLE